MKKERHLKVVEQSGHKYKPTPTITLKGQWLREWGFEVGSKIAVTYEGDGKIKIEMTEDARC